MKGIIIFEDTNPTLKNVYCININNSDVTMNIRPEAVYTLTGVRDGMKTAACNKDDTYDFETGALIALMKMCGADKVKKAAKETFFGVAENSVNEYEEKIHALENTRDLLTNKNNELIEEIKRLKEKLEKRKKLMNTMFGLRSIAYESKVTENAELKQQVEKLEKENKDLKAANCAKAILNGKLLKDYDTARSAYEIISEKYADLTEKVKELEEENEKLKLDCEKLQHGYIDRDRILSLLESSKYVIPYTDKSSKPLTKREKMWEKIFALHKKNDVIIEVKKEDVNTFLHEIEDKFPEITWLSGVKIFETKYTIKDVYFELKSHDVIYFRLSRATKLTYTSDPHIYPYRELKIIDYLPPMRWDLFKKGRLAVKVDYDNYKEFYEACEKELGKKPSFIYTGDFTVSICKKDGNFEIFTMEDQKKTGRKIVDWEDVR